MSIQKIRIIQTADMQYKNREHNLLNSYEKTSEEIERILIETKADVYAFCGDFTEYPNPNDSERALMFRHLGNSLNISSLKEMLVMNGNHDLIVGKKIELSQKENNPLDTFVKTTKALNPDIYRKITYLKQQKEYDSIVSNLISWVSYSLENGTSTGSNLILNQDNDKKYRIPIFHDILKQYVDDKKLPISKNKYDYLMNLEDFKTNPNQKALILAGDIHENYSKLFLLNDKESKFFIYPGSPIQRNHGEGSYFRVRPTGPQVIHAATKVVKQIDLFIDTDNVENTYYEVTDIPLTNTLQYTKIDLNTKKFVENWKEQLTHLISNIQISNNVNIVKLEMSNVYMKYEMEILTMINEFYENKNKENACINYIELGYGTVVFDKDELTIDSEINEIESDEVIEQNIDEIVLNQDKLNQIFAKILEANNQNILKEFTNPEEFQEIVDEIRSLFEEQIELTYGNKISYTTDFEKIVINNGFMALGPNNILLDIPGLTRIDGNNGIGKTTLFNILRWNIKGYVLEGLPKNIKKENLLLVFNHELIKQDFISNTLYLKVNNIPVEIERTAKRVWKTKATDEDKKGLNWKTFIDTATSTLTLRVYPKDKDMVVKMNDDAQMMIDQWFGNTIETIFILNQYKILQLLNSSGDTLKETVLDYIGIDYIKSLISNLEMVKPKYVVSKPEKSQMDIVVDKNKTIQLISEGTIKINDMSELIKNNLEVKNISENNINVKNQQLIDLGNIPDLIIKNTNETNSFQNKLDSFKVKESKVLPKFDDVEPNKPDNKELESTIEELISNEKEYLTKITDNSNSFNTDKENKVTVVNENISKYQTENQKIVQEAKDKLSENIELSLPKIKENKNTIYKYWIDKHNELKNTEKEKASKLNSKVNDNKLKRNELVGKINLLRNEIDNDICSGCKRSMDLTEEDIEQKEKEILHYNELKVNFNEEITTLETQINSINQGINNIDLDINKLNQLLNWNSDYSSKAEIIKDIKIIDENKEIFIDGSDFEITKVLNEILIDWNKFDNIEENEKIVANKELITKFNALLTKLATLNLTSKITEELEAIKFISDLIDKIKNNNSLTVDYDNYKSNRIEKESELKEINKKYNEDLSKYNIALSTHNKNITEINEYNTSIIEYNKSPIDWQSNINRLKTELESLNENKYYYEKYKTELFDLNEGLTKLNSDVDNWRNQINNLEKANVLYEQNIVTLNELEEKWKQYRKKNFIYKTYEKLIKNDFKYAIFNYYRTFLNNKLNILLEGLNFRLYWNNDSNLYMVKLAKNSEGTTEMNYIPVKLASGMQTAFLGLSLIYSFHLLNIRNSISHIFIDEISGQLNSGKNKGVTDDEILDEATKKNYQEQLVLLLSRFDKKKVFIIDHVIDQLYETHTYNVKRKKINGDIVTVYD